MRVRRFVVVPLAVVVTLGVGALGLVAHERAESRGAISGHLFGVGGPPHPPLPWPGTVVVRQFHPALFLPSKTDFIKTVAVGSDGSFSVSVPPGTYLVGGTSPLYEAGHAECHSSQSQVTVKRGDVVNVDVLCDMR